MTINKQDITAVILAGGQGSRLDGQDKGLVTYKNKRLIEHTLAIIEPQVNTILISANRNTDIYKAYGYPVIKDKLKNYQGPLAGLSAAMTIATTDYIISMPCDSPLLSDDLVSRLILSLQQQSLQQSLSIAVAHDGQRLQPVTALIPIKLLHSLNSFLASGERKTAFWYAQHDYICCDFSDIAHIFANINTEQQRRAMED
jgi:molybdenum cofactor guanylyltransferase